MIDQLMPRIHYVAAAIVFVIGFYTMLSHSNLIKKIMGMNIMETAVFLLFVAAGYSRGSRASIVTPGTDAAYVNPLPSALILTGIVIAVGATAFALNLIVALYRRHGTLDADRLSRARMMGQ